MERERVTEVLLRGAAGSPEALDELYPLVYAELHAAAARRLRGERADHTLQPTEIVHEVYLRLVNAERCTWKDRAHFMAIGARSIRHILVDHARRRSAQRREGGWEKLPQEAADALPSRDADTSMLALGEALEKLEAIDPQKARLVELLYFAGLTQEECAEALGISRRTVVRWWDYAQSWLYREISGGGQAA